jgi:hypothetical protein
MKIFKNPLKLAKLSAIWPVFTRCQQVKKICAHFWRRNAKNRAFRSKSSDLPMQILRAFRFNPLRPTGFSGFGTTS